MVRDRTGVRVPSRRDVPQPARPAPRAAGPPRARRRRCAPEPAASCRPLATSLPGPGGPRGAVAAVLHRCQAPRQPAWSPGGPDPPAAAPGPRRGVRDAAGQAGHSRGGSAGRQAASYTRPAPRGKRAVERPNARRAGPGTTPPAGRRHSQRPDGRPGARARGRSGTRKRRGPQIALFGAARTATPNGQDRRHNGGYSRASADQGLLRAVIRFLALRLPAESARVAVAPNARLEACRSSYSACLTTARAEVGVLRTRAGTWLRAGGASG